MSTDTQTPIDPNIGSRFTDAIDTSYLDEPPAERSGAKPRPTPGEYFLQAGIVTGEAVPERSGESEKGPWSFPAHVRVKPDFSIVADADGGDEYAGCALNSYYRLSSERVVMGKNPQNYSTLSSAFDAFGLDMPRGTADEIIEAAQNLSGLKTTRPVFLTLNGSTGKMGSNKKLRYKPFFPLGTGGYFRLTEKAFRLGDENGSTEGSIKAYKANGGRWAVCGWILDPDDDGMRSWTLARPSENVAAHQVFVNLEPTDSGFQPKGR